MHKNSSILIPGGKKVTKRFFYNIENNSKSITICDFKKLIKDNKNMVRKIQLMIFLTNLKKLN